jgi:hypothetical protein
MALSTPMRFRSLGAPATFFPASSYGSDSHLHKNVPLCCASKYSLSNSRVSRSVFLLKFVSSLVNALATIAEQNAHALKHTSKKNNDGDAYREGPNPNANVLNANATKAKVLFASSTESANENLSSAQSLASIFILANSRWRLTFALTSKALLLLFCSFTSFAANGANEYGKNAAASRKRAFNPNFTHVNASAGKAGAIQIAYTIESAIASTQSASTLLVENLFS